MADDKNMLVARSFVVGAALGAVLALLFTPKSGNDTRRYIKNQLKKAQENASDKAKTVSEKAKAGSQQLKKSATELKEELKKDTGSKQGKP